MRFFLFVLFLFASLNASPRVSIITSMWNGDDFIEGFLEDITQQTIFSECELILINANSPGNEEAVIEKYLPLYPNILYIKLDEDPGVYGVWNYGIQLATADLITNANLDDRSQFDALERHVNELDQNPHIDLVYSGYLLTENPNETYVTSQYRWIVDPPEFAPHLMYLCLPGPRPVWRKSVHERFGYFDEAFISAGDFEMWCRAVSMGAQFKKIPGYTTLFYSNPKGLSTDPDPQKTERRKAEVKYISVRYSYLWQ